MSDQDIETRRREIAVEHIVFELTEYVEPVHPGLLDHLLRSLDLFDDPANDASKDDEAVRAIALRMIVGARRDAHINGS